MDVSRVRGSKSTSSSSESIANSDSGYASNEGDNIKVFVRIRPPVKSIDVDQSVCLEVTSPTSITILSKPEPKLFTYDHVASMASTQEEVFSTVGKGIIESFVAGFNGTIFAYGQTGSGKTFTMLGPSDDASNECFSHELRGVIPRGFDYLFNLINREQEKAGDRVEFLARCSFLEIYNEQIFDLLDAASTGLHLRENINKGVFVEGLQERDVASAKDAYHVLQAGWQNRRVASTSMNRESSRSHAVFTVSLESKTRKGGTANVKMAKLHLVDLAGSERQKDTHTEDARLKEAGSINKSLSALGNVIMALVDIAHGKKRHVHYRDSKLTFILRDSLGGNAKTYIIANVHPSSRCFGETLSTLQFARRAKMIKNKAIVNEDVTGNVSELKEEVRKLKELLAEARQSTVSGEKRLQTEGSSSSSPSASPLNASFETGANLTRLDAVSKWKNMMMNAISEREKSENEKEGLSEKVQKLEELCRRKEKFLQSTKMILKFREMTIKKLDHLVKKEFGQKDTEEDSKDKEIQLLKDELKLTQTKVEHHPDVTRFAMENLELRSEVKRLRSLDPSNGELTAEMAKSHRYTLQLEKQLKELITRQHDSSSSNQQSLEASNTEVERLKLEVAGVQARTSTMQTELDGCRTELQQRREELVDRSESFRIRELDLTSELTSLRKMNHDLERSLESLQLKAAVERTALNSLHMQTVKVLSSPRKFGTPNRSSNSKMSTPLKSSAAQNLSLNSSLGGLPRKQDTPIKKSTLSVDVKSSTPKEETELPTDCYIGDEPTPKRRNSASDSSSEDEEDLGNPFWQQYCDTTHDEEAIYIEALQDELKSLQDLYAQSVTLLHTEQHKIITSGALTTKLNHQVKEINELLRQERTSWNEKESEMSRQICSLRESYKEAHGNAAVMQSELEESQLSFTTIEKQFESIKREKKEENIEHARKLAAAEAKLVKVEVNFFNMQAEFDSTAEANNNLQAVYETCKDELEFFRHKNSELEEIVNLERKKNKDLDEHLKVVVEKLNIEVETNIKLAAHEDKQNELTRAFETIASLRNELQVLTKKLEDQETQISKLNDEADICKAETVTQKWVNVSDKEAIRNFMQTVQDLRAVNNEKESEISCVCAELEELQQKHQQLQTSYEEKEARVQKLTDNIKFEVDRASTEKASLEGELKLLQEEVDASNKQCEELSSTLEQQQSQLQLLQGELTQANDMVLIKTTTISMLEESISDNTRRHEDKVEELHQQIESKDMSALIDQQSSELLTVKEQLNNFLQLSQDWEVARHASQTELVTLQQKILEMEEQVRDSDRSQQQVSILDARLIEEQEHLNKTTTRLNCELESSRKELSIISEHLEAANQAKDRERQGRATAEQKVKQQEMNLFNLQDDLDCLQDEMSRLRLCEEKYFREKEGLKSSLEIALEEKNKFLKENIDLEALCSKLSDDNVKLASHQNPQQKINVLMDLKRENNDLKSEIQRLQTLADEGYDGSGKRPLAPRNHMTGHVPLAGVSDAKMKLEIVPAEQCKGKENEAVYS